MDKLTEEELKKLLPDGARTPEEIRRDAERHQRYEEEWKKDIIANGPLTVGGLREILKAFDDDAVVMVEGCDCVGRAFYVDLDVDGVVIRRQP